MESSGSSRRNRHGFNGNKRDHQNLEESGTEDCVPDETLCSSTQPDCPSLEAESHHSYLIAKGRGLGTLVVRRRECGPTEDDGGYREDKLLVPGGTHKALKTESLRGATDRTNTPSLHIQSGARDSPDQQDAADHEPGMDTVGGGEGVAGTTTVRRLSKQVEKLEKIAVGKGWPVMSSACHDHRPQRRPRTEYPCIKSPLFPAPNSGFLAAAEEHGWYAYDGVIVMEDLEDAFEESGVQILCVMFYSSPSASYGIGRSFHWEDFVVIWVGNDGFVREWQVDGGDYKTDILWEESEGCYMAIVEQCGWGAVQFESKRRTEVEEEDDEDENWWVYEELGLPRPQRE